jgi:dihydroxyacid dehydratase/phosphogluconate dehydratase
MSSSRPFKEHAGIVVLRGNLAPDGAVIKPSAASPHLLKHRGRAVVFENYEDFHGRIDDDSLEIDEHCVMILKGCGPKGFPGWPSGKYAAPAQGLAARHHGYGADLGCTDVAAPRMEPSCSIHRRRRLLEETSR